MYNPYDVVSEPSAFGLRRIRVRSAFGLIEVIASRNREGSTATVYLHGVAADWSTWTPVLAADRAIHRVGHDQVFINMPGFGGSENRRGDLEIEAVGNAYLDVLDQLRYEKMRLVGHSMGGFLALDMAGRHPGDVVSLHLVAGPYFSILEHIQHPFTSLSRVPLASAIFGSQYALARLGDFGRSLIVAANRAQILRPALAPFFLHPTRLRQSVVDALIAQYNALGTLRTAANGPGYDAEATWGRYQGPTVALFGEHDHLVPERDMKRYQQLNPGATTVQIPECRHFPNVEQPDAVASALRLWDDARTGF